MKYIDLSHSLSSNTATYPSDPDLNIIKEKEIINDNSLLHSFKMGTHTGTHLDVPAHIIPGGKTLNMFSLDCFSGQAIKVDLNCYDKLHQLNGEIDGIIFETGWYKNFNNSKKFYGHDRPIIPKKLIERIIDLEIKFFACDLPSVDRSGSKKKPIHHALLGRDIIIYESLTNLNQLPFLSPFNFFGFPLPFKDLDGCPVRAIAALG